MVCKYEILSNLEKQNLKDRLFVIENKCNILKNRFNSESESESHEKTQIYYHYISLMSSSRSKFNIYRN